MEREAFRQALTALHQRPIAYYPCYARLMGSATGGILLSQLLYWWGACDGRKFDKSDSQLREETMLSEWEFRAAKKKLKHLNFLKATREGIPAKAYYEVDSERLLMALSLISSLDVSSQLDTMKHHNRNGCIITTGDDVSSQLFPETPSRDSPEISPPTPPKQVGGAGDLSGGKKRRPRRGRHADHKVAQYPAGRYCHDCQEDI